HQPRGHAVPFPLAVGSDPGDHDRSQCVERVERPPRVEIEPLHLAAPAPPPAKRRHHGTTSRTAVVMPGVAPNGTTGAAPSTPTPSTPSEWQPVRGPARTPR